MQKRIFFFILCLVAVYIYLHNPVLTITGGMGLIKLLYPFALIYLIGNYNSFSYELGNTFSQISKFFILLLIYSIFRGIIGGDMLISYSHLIMYFECLVFPILFALYWKSKGLSSNYFIKVVLAVSSLASIITTLCILSPSFGTYVRFVLLTTPKDSYLAEALFRGFGISEELTSGYGYVQAISFVLGIHYYKKNKWYAFFMPLVILSVIVNARTGIVVMIAGVILHLLTIRSLNSLISTFAMFVLLFVLTTFAFDNIDISDETSDFILGFFNETNEITTSKSLSDSQTTAALFSDMIILPNSINEWIFGRGINIFKLARGNSDIGYFIQLNYGGLIYIFIWLRILMWFYHKLKEVSLGSFLPLFIIFTLLILNTKGNTLSNGSVMRFIMLFLSVMVLNTKNHPVKEA